MKRYEKEAFLKSFFLFFTTLILLNSIIFWLYFSEQKRVLEEDIFNKIKLYNYTFSNKDIDIDIIPHVKLNELYTLHIEKNQIYAYFDIPSSKKNVLKIIYSYKKYQKRLKKIFHKSIIYFIISSFILLLLSIGYSFYAMKPLKNALYLLEEFLKDIIHDLNTPISSILLNLNILKKRVSPEAIKRIEFSTKKIGKLYNNLEISIKDTPLNYKNIDIKKLIKDKIEYYSYLYPNINFKTDININILKTSQIELSRILDNLISNACKYNKDNGEIYIYIDKEKIVIEDTGIGIKNTNRVFERFYKESDRGIGLGLNIVEKLSKKLGYKIKIDSTVGVGTKIELTQILQ